MHERTNRQKIMTIIRNSLDVLDPFNVVTQNLAFDPDNHMATIAGRPYPLEPDRGLWVLGGGKAAATMGRAVEEVFGARIRDGILIAPKDSTRKPSSEKLNGKGLKKENLQRIQLMHGTHPLPDKDSLAATMELVQLAGKIPPEDLVLCLVSGGTSALFCLPAGDLEAEELAETYRLLLRSGADIHKMNVVRTALSQIKGGGLLQCLSHTSVIDLIISDVPGDDFKTIGSGPTTPVEKDYKQAFQILKSCDIWNDIPHEVRVFIAKGMYNPPVETREVPKEHNQYLISSAGLLAGEVGRQCKTLGYEVEVADESYNMPISDLEKMIAGKIRENGHASVESANESAGSDEENSKKRAGGSKKAGRNSEATNGSPNVPPRALVFYGESSVTVSGNGKGGRNQELALRVATHLSPEDRVTFASIGTDGVDGPTDAAGAVVDGLTGVEAERKGLDPESFLSDNDSYHFFDKAGGLIRTGPTGNNLMDLQVVLID